MMDGKVALCWKKFEVYLKNEDYFINADVQGIVSDDGSDSCDSREGKNKNYINQINGHRVYKKLLIYEK